MIAVLKRVKQDVCAKVAGKMGSEATHFLEAPESEQEIRRSCRQVKQLYHDPTVVHRLNLQVAIAEERYDDACEYDSHQFCSCAIPSHSPSRSFHWAQHSLCAL